MNRNDGKYITMLCNTPYQLIVASYLKYQLFKNDIVTIYISDQINNYNILEKNILQTLMFEKVALLYKGKINKLEKTKFKRGIFHMSYRCNLAGWLNKYVSYIPEQCDIFLCANIELFPLMFCKYFACDLELYEDGIASYSRELGDFYQEIEKKRCGIKKRRYACFAKAKAIYLFQPELLKWDPYFPVKKMESFCNDNTFIKILNQMFGFVNEGEYCSEKYIFFEEAYAADGRAVDDVTLVKFIAKIVGKNNLLIKRHPRSMGNRFENLGFHTNTKAGVPWEVIALNMRLDKKVVITIASAAAITPYLLFGMEMDTIVLYKLFPDAPLKRNVLEVFEEICGNFTRCQIPQNVKTLETILETNMREGAL